MDTKFSIALHILVYIEETENVVTSELLAKSVGTNASHIRKIITLLKDANIIESRQGKKGMSLKVKSDKLTLDIVYSAVYPEKGCIFMIQQIKNVLLEQISRKLYFQYLKSQRNSYF